MNDDDEQHQDICARCSDFDLNNTDTDTGNSHYIRCLRHKCWVSDKSLFEENKLQYKIDIFTFQVTTFLTTCIFIYLSRFPKHNYFGVSFMCLIIMFLCIHNIIPYNS